eukprot:CAMPEP_0177352680 /NCGR_PEP_ID=MMETSP0368-20130122/32481_1 /TAXON_ID=447022 ORGANISM="Scrippsiella hangoei-like, Strain SHHI-4" /NCGR_SAMPLE_ID=MMETSP0368 /ASSEMBLY_ACC=CAM_ASM_000363 /LENGTH=146 /DNA_ID=CAMNT_0018814681 /DNA_START=42 /DNA_END=480 /DNA_ORIENTATION=-
MSAATPTASQAFTRRTNFQLWPPIRDVPPPECAPLPTQLSETPGSIRRPRRRPPRPRPRPPEHPADPKQLSTRTLSPLASPPASGRRAAGTCPGAPPSACRSGAGAKPPQVLHRRFHPACCSSRRRGAAAATEAAPPAAPPSPSCR